jgi:NitT/TauT family transport system substrate-binding protein
MGEPVRALVMTEKLYRERRDVALRVLKCFVDATRLFLNQPETAERYVREKMFSRQLSHEEYQDAILNSPFTYDITVQHIQVTTDLMAKYSVGRMANPPRAADWTRTDLLEQAKRELQVK